ncbi:PEPxxWA-CTERM sorting domain-containing protein [Sphingomonas sp.]|uniref:PEPxxWA-CTERM sorting domain-containing protein n=1 Tax=Sphingomonas sp. TaxID=28214 RepID=UPI0025E6198A|nr:PEPxxWA-CTERM sorting domain-containing protein [Sphingomonas sp.]
MNKVMAIAAAAGMMFAASTASAQAVKVTNVAFTPGSVTGSVHSSLLNGDVGVGQFEFKGNYVSNNAPFDILTYCIDLAHSVSLGNVNYTNYTIIPISSYAGMTTAKSNALNALLTNTTQLLGAATGQNAINISAATQMAVWEIMFETQSAWSVTNSSSAFYMTTPGGSSQANLTALTSAESLANTYLSNVKNNVWTVNNGYDLKVLYSPTNQSQVFVTPSVPEPATWGMLVIGFGLVGGALRTRRRSGVIAAA